MQKSQSLQSGFLFTNQAIQKDARKINRSAKMSLESTEPVTRTYYANQIRENKESISRSHQKYTKCQYLSDFKLQYFLI